MSAWEPQTGQPVAPDELVSYAPRAWALAASYVPPDSPALNNIPHVREVLATAFLFVALTGEGMATASSIVEAIYNAPTRLFWGLSLGGATEIDEQRKHVVLRELSLNVPIKVLATRTGEAAARDVAILLWAQCSAVRGCSAQDTQLDPEAALRRAVEAWALRNTSDATWVGNGGEA